jgi:hypothetical protein
VGYLPYEFNRLLLHLIKLWMLKKKAMGLMLANNRGFAAALMVLLKNRVGCAHKLLLANPHTNLVQSSDILDQRSLLHLGQPVIY